MLLLLCLGRPLIWSQTPITAKLNLKWSREHGYIVKVHGGMGVHKTILDLFPRWPLPTLRTWRVLDAPMVINQPHGVFQPHGILVK